MIKLLDILFEIQSSTIISPKDVYNFYYLSHISATAPKYLNTQYGKNVQNYYLSKIKQKYLSLFKDIVKNQLVKYYKKGRVDSDFDGSKLNTDLSTDEMDMLMNKTYRSDMTRRNTVWNDVTEYLNKLDNANSPKDIYVYINWFNNSVHNTDGKIITDSGKVFNYAELERAFVTVDSIKSSNHWEFIKSKVDKDIRELYNQDQDY